MFMAQPGFPQVRALIFDLDGTLIDSKLDLILSVNAMLRQLGRGELHEDIISGYIGRGAPTLVAKALGTEASPEDCQRGLEYFLAYYEAHKMDNTCLYPGVAKALHGLAHLPMAILTNKPVRVSIRILEALGLADRFRVIYGGNSFATKKPDPFGANVILRELGTSADRTMLVGDSEIDVQTARNAGTFAAVVNYGFGIYDRRAFPADIYLDRLGDLVTLLPAAG